MGAPDATPAAVQNARLSTGPVSRLVDAAVLPDHEWATPRWLDVTFPDVFDRKERVTADNPPRMLFVLSPTCAVELPSESGILHMRELDADSRVLAPWAIDDATDRLFLASTAPEPIMSLATDSLRGLFWGLHDWAHFHSHGPFERIAETELQCDVAALVWLWEARATFLVDESTYARIVADVLALWQQRFSAEARAHDPAPALEYLVARAGVPRSALPRGARA